MTAPVQLIVASFKTEDGAEKALAELKAAKKDHLIRIDNAAVLRKDAAGKVHIKELKDMGGGKGAAIGGLLGAGLAILTGGATLAVAGLGAVLGGVAAKASDAGFKDDRLKTLGDSLTPGSSAIVAVIEHRWIEDYEAAMREQQADVFTTALAADIATQLEANRESAYTVLSTDEGVAGGRVVTGEDVTATSSFVATDAGFAAERAVVTSEGAAAERLVVTDKDAEYTAVVVTPEDGEPAKPTNEPGGQA
jgi:uncharacterized membrane protein